MAATSEVEVHFKPVIDAPAVRPGDKLIVRVAHGVTREVFDRITNELAEQLPGVDIVVVAADQLVIYRPEDKADLGQFSMPKPGADRG